MLEQIKLSMRISHNHLDTDIEFNINTAMEDLKRVGVDTLTLSDLLIKAVELYCKAEYDYAGKGDQFSKKYKSLRNAMSLSADYKGANTDV